MRRIAVRIRYGVSRYGRRQWLRRGLTICSTISGILAMKAFRKQFSTGYIDPADGLPNVSPTQSSQIVAILSAGTFFGALMAAPMGDKLGRRTSLIMAVAIFAFGVLLQTIAMAIPLLISGRYGSPSRVLLHQLTLFVDFLLDSELELYRFWFHFTNLKWRPNGFEGR
jgi:MFS family permease